MAAHLNFGKNIARIRTRQSLSQEELAEKSGISRSMLSKIERGEVSPTIAMANKLAVGLHIPLSSLLDDKPHDRVQIIRATDRIEQEDPHSHIQRQLLMHSPAKGLGFFQIIIPPGGTTGLLPALTNQSEKFFYIEKGILKVILDSADAYLLYPGDCMSFASDIEHECRNDFAATCHYFIVQYDPPDAWKRA